MVPTSKSELAQLKHSRRSLRQACRGTGYFRFKGGFQQFKVQALMYEKLQEEKLNIKETENDKTN